MNHLRSVTAFALHGLCGHAKVPVGFKRLWTEIGPQPVISSRAGYHFTRNNKGLKKRQLLGTKLARVIPPAGSVHQYRAFYGTVYFRLYVDGTASPQPRTRRSGGYASCTWSPEETVVRVWPAPHCGCSAELPVWYSVPLSRGHEGGES